MNSRLLEDAMKPKYFVTTWDSMKQDYTPQPGVRTGPWSLFGLRRALRALRMMGYEVKRPNAHSVLVVKRSN
jgi:hypothetical protein